MFRIVYNFSSLVSEINQFFLLCLGKGQIFQMGPQWLQIQSKKITIQFSTFSLSCGVWPIIYSKNFVQFN